MSQRDGQAALSKKYLEEREAVGAVVSILTFPGLIAAETCSQFEGKSYMLYLQQRLPRSRANFIIEERGVGWLSDSSTNEWE